jgi:hypothetical protein
VDALERHLDRMDQFEPRTTGHKHPVRSSTPTKRKVRKTRRGPNRERDKGETK